MTALGDSAPAWAVWLALGLWGVAIIVCAVAVMLARRLWAERLRPLVVPLIEMFAPSSPVVERIEPFTSDPRRDRPVPPDANELGGIF